MSAQIARKLKVEGNAAANAPAAPSPDAKKVRRVRKIAPPQPKMPLPVPEQPKEPVTVTPPEAPAIPTPAVEPEGFACTKCGIRLEAHTDECPICGERYVELPKDAVNEPEKVKDGLSGVSDDLIGRDFGEKSCAVFDADEGVLDFLEKGPKAYEVALICSECGTALEFATDVCPLCGTEMESADAGLVGLVSEMTFDEYASDEIDCPQCGERVKLVKGKCPECKATVMRSDPHGVLRRIDPVIHGDNIVFLHLDVATGELSYLQRSVNRERFEKLTVRLEGT